MGITCHKLELGQNMPLPRAGSQKLSMEVWALALGKNQASHQGMSVGSVFKILYVQEEP